MLAEPVKSLRFDAIGQLRTRRAAARVPDILDAVRLGHIEQMVILALELDVAHAAIDRRVVFLSKPVQHARLGRDPGEIFRLALRRHGPVAQGEALMIPRTARYLRCPDPHQLQAFEVGRMGQRRVGDVIGFVARQGEADGERELRHRFADGLGATERNRWIDAIDDPDVGRCGMREVVRSSFLHHPGHMSRPERLAPGRVGDQRHQRAGVALRVGREIQSSSTCDSSGSA